MKRNIVMNEILSIRNILKPRRLLSHIGLKLGYKFRLQHVPLLPTTLDIEPNNWCNFKCDHCHVTHWSKPKNELSVEKFEQITNQFPNLLLVKVQGMGEPFLNKSTINMLEMLDKDGIAATITSNGSVLTEKLIQRLSRLRYASISFSMDGATKNTFEGIRIKGNFDKVTANIKKLTSVCTNLKMAFWVVLSNQNIDECEQIISVAKDVGVDEVTFQSFLTNWGKDEMKDKITPKLADQKNLRLKVSKAIEKGEKENIRVNSYAGDLYTLKKPCQWPWTSMYIDAVGDVVPCCVLADAETINFGNVVEKSVKKIWNSKEYKKFRKLHKEGNIPDICKSCYRLD